MVAPIPRSHPMTDAVSTLASTASWRRQFLQNFLPLATSLALHAVIIVAGITTYQVVSKLRATEVQQIIEPDLGMSDSAGAQLPMTDLTRSSAGKQMDFPDVPQTAQGASNKLRTDLAAVLGAGGQGGGDDANALIGVSTKGGLLGRGPGLTGTGDGTELGTGFGVPGLGPYGNGGSFLGLASRIDGGNARHITFVCDASGSMLQKFDSLRVELRKAVDTLQPTQSFGIIFFQDLGSRALENNLLPATPQAKRRAADFIDSTAPRGQTDPLPALTAAFAQKPQLIYLLTDGEFPNNKAVLDLIARLNADRKVKLNTILFVGSQAEADENKEFAKILKQIATENGGLYKLADAASLP